MSLDILIRQLQGALGGKTISGPYTCSGSSQASGVESNYAVTHNLGLANLSDCVISGHLFDGTWASQCSWRAAPAANSVTFYIKNNGPNSATPNIRFYVIHSG